MRLVSFVLIVIGALILYQFTTPRWQTNTTETISYFYDGDTVKIATGQTEYKLRVTHIDAPEYNQPHGLEARHALIQLCEDADIQVVMTGQDKYQRTLGTLFCNQQNVATHMVTNGHAWFNDRFSNDLMLALKERQAREKQLGLWANTDPIAPWVWREQQRTTSTQP